MPYMTEAMLAAGEGVPLAVIDAAAVQFGMPMGPIELADIVGLDVCLHVGRILAAAFGGAAPEAVAPLVAAGKLGRKTGEGLYVWRDGKAVKPAVDPAYRAPDDLQDRLMLPLVNEAMAVLREGVVADADLIDAGVIFGAGFAPFRGGPLRYARERGVAETVSSGSEDWRRGMATGSCPDAGWTGVRDAGHAVISSRTFCQAASMSTDPTTVEPAFLRAFSPLDGLKNENLRALARKTVLRELDQGRLLFKEGDTDKRTYYLVERHWSSCWPTAASSAASAAARPMRAIALAPILPRRCTARVASDKIEYLSIDSDLLDVLLTWDQTGPYEVGELKAGNEAGRRLDDDAAAEPRLPPHSAGQPAGDLHAHAAHALLAPAT